MLKVTALNLGFHGGLFRLAQLALRRRQAVILTFHRFVGNGHGHPCGLPIGRFEQFLRYLTRRYRVVSLAELTWELRRGAVTPSSVAVTVDDGYHEVATLAAPLLRRYNVPATFFVVSDLVEGRLWLWTDRFRFVFHHAPLGVIEVARSGSVQRIEIGGERDRVRKAEQWREYAKGLPMAERDELLAALARAWGIDLPAEPPPEYRPLTWTELKTLAQQGFDVGAHTKTHPILSSIPAAHLRAEIGECKEELEQRLDVPVPHFAYPNGKGKDYTAEAVQAVARAGYRAAVTAIHVANTAATSLLELFRVDGGREDLAHFAQSVSGFEQVKIGAGAGAGERGAWPAAAAPADGRGDRS
jgi:peptidoglycan/xylan/chitin deacetylase (PgdA/CDA1 family)